MLAELTPEQALELTLYAGVEPFGEVRNDMRFANFMRLYYDSKRGKSGKKLKIGSFTLYPDLHETDDENQSRAELEAQLSTFAVRSDG